MSDGLPPPATRRTPRSDHRGIADDGLDAGRLGGVAGNLGAGGHLPLFRSRFEWAQFKRPQGGAGRSPTTGLPALRSRGSFPHPQRTADLQGFAWGCAKGAKLTLLASPRDALETKGFCPLRT